MKHRRLRRAAALVMGLLVSLVSGVALIFTVFTEDLKHQYDLEESSVEVIASVGLLGFSMGYPAGLLIECLGTTRSYILAAVVGSSSCFLLHTTQSNVEFYSRYWGLIAAYWAGVGISACVMFLMATTINMGNFPPQHRGLIVGAIGASWWTGSALLAVMFDTAYSGYEYSISSYFLLLGTLFGLLNVASACLIVRVPPTVEEEEAWSYLVPSTPSNVTPIDKIETCAERTGLSLLLVPDFHLVTYAFLLGSCVMLSFIINVNTFCLAYRHDELIPYLNVVGPLCASGTKCLSGWTSDVTLHRCSRVVYLMMAAAVQTIILLINVFYAEASSVLVATTVIIYFTYGVYYVLLPIIISERFGMHHLNRNWGFEFFLSALVVSGILYSMGSFYDEQTANRVSIDCYDMSCFGVYYIVCTFLSFLSLCFFLALYFRIRRQAEQQ